MIIKGGILDDARADGNSLAFSRACMVCIYLAWDFDFRHHNSTSSRLLNPIEVGAAWSLAFEAWILRKAGGIVLLYYELSSCSCEVGNGKDSALRRSFAVWTVHSH